MEVQYTSSYLWPYDNEDRPGQPTDDETILESIEVPPPTPLEAPLRDHIAPYEMRPRSQPSRTLDPSNPPSARHPRRGEPQQARLARGAITRRAPQRAYWAVVREGHCAPPPGSHWRSNEVRYLIAMDGRDEKESWDDALEALTRLYYARRGEEVWEGGPQVAVDTGFEPGSRARPEERAPVTPVEDGREVPQWHDTVLRLRRARQLRRVNR